MRVNNLMKVPDLNSAVDSLDNKIPQHLSDIKANLEEISDVKESLNELIKVITSLVEDVKLFTENITTDKWRIIKRDIYLIIFFSGIGIFFLAGLITIEILFILMYF